MLGVLIAGIAALAAPFTTWVVARSQRATDRANRIYKDKLAAYQAIASDAYHGRDLVGECAERLAKPGVTDADAKALIDQLDTDISALNTTEPTIIAQMTVVAPENVVDARDDFVEAWNKATTELLYDADRTAAGFAGRARKLAEDAEPILRPALGKLREAMRDDLCT